MPSVFCAAAGVQCCSASRNRPVWGSDTGHMGNVGLRELVRFLKTTEFGDVAQGLTKPDLDRLPRI